MAIGTLLISMEFFFTKDSNSSDSSSMGKSSLTHINPLRSALLCFSWRRNMGILYSSASKHCIHDVVEVAGLRALSLLWILLIHVCTFVYYLAGKKQSFFVSESKKKFHCSLHAINLSIFL